MKLKEGIRPVSFLEAVRQCQGDVYFLTEHGDCLNLKSQLTRYVFLAATADETQSLIENGSVRCSAPADYQLLAPYLKKENDGGK